MSSNSSLAAALHEGAPLRQRARVRSPMLVLAAALVVGIVADSCLPLPGSLVGLLWAAVAWMVWLGLWRRERLVAGGAALLASVAALGAAWHHMAWHEFSANEVGRFANEESAPVCLEAVVASVPQRVLARAYSPLQGAPTSDQTRLFVAVERVRAGREWQAAAGRARLAVEGHLLGLQTGDRVRVFGFLSQPSAPANPGEFDFASYERGSRILCRLRADSPDSVERLTPVAWWNPANWLAQLRAQGKAHLAGQLKRREAELASALLLGFREGVDPESTQAFLQTGTIHLLSISGMHVGILAGFFLLAARSGVLPRRGTLLAVAAAIVAYALLADANPPVIRATVLVVLYCAAALWGRQALSFNALAAAACVVLALNPSDLFRVGTQLSFLAVATLAYFQPLLAPTVELDPLRRFIARSRPWPWRWGRACGAALGRAWLAGALVWLVTLPLVIGQYHLVTPVALVVNLLAAVPAATALISGFGVLASSWLLPPLTPLCGTACDFSLASLEWLVRASQQTRGGYFYVAGPAPWWIAACYAALGLWAAFPAWRPRPLWQVALAGAGLAIGMASTVPADRWRVERPEAPVRATFISVGHGTSVLVELPGGGVLLYDAGGMSSPQAAARAIASVLWSRGLNHVDAVVLSHADIDHYNAVPDLLERISVGAAYVSPVMFREEVPALAELKSALARRGVPLREVRAGDRLASGGPARLEVLHPVRRGMVGNDNANSLVLLIEHGGQRLLLPGDLEGPGLSSVLAEEPISCQVVMAPHHGSVRSGPAEFVAWSTPRLVIISGGRGPEAHAAQAAYRAAGALVLHTAECGAITLSLDETGVAFESSRPAATAWP